MKEYPLDKVRNIGIIAHGGAGKTSLAEAILFNSGAIERLGKTVDGTTTMDYEPEEIHRKISITSAMGFCEWKGYKINILDTPGYINFIEDARGCLRALDGAVLLVSAISGVKAETEKVWGYAEDYGIPRIIFVNKMDRERASFGRALEAVEKAFKKEVVPVYVPIGAEATFSGLIDLIAMKAYRYADNNQGKFVEENIPDDLVKDSEDYRKRLIEKVVETDDTLIERYLEGQEINREEIAAGLKMGTITGKFVPLLCGSAVKNIGISQLLDTVVSCLPSPVEKAKLMPITGKNPRTKENVTREPSDAQPLSALIFKTIADPYAGRLSLFRVYSGIISSDSTVYNATRDKKDRIGHIFLLQGKKQIPVQKLGAGNIGAVAKLKETMTWDTFSDEKESIVFNGVKFASPVISCALEPKTKGDDEKVSNSIARLLEEDPTLHFKWNEQTREMILSGMGQLHLDVTIEKLKRKFGVEVIMKTPKVAYKETIKGSTKVQGKYKKQSGGRGQYGDTWLQIEPLPRGRGFEFVDKVVGGAIPRQYIPAVEKGVVEAMHEGVLAGYPVVDVRVTLYDGSYHSVDSSEMAFKIAASMGFKKGVLESTPVLLEPVMNMEILVPDDCVGNIIGDLNSKRGKVLGMIPQNNIQKIKAQLPMAEILKYAQDLQSITGGRGTYTMEFSHYEEVPEHLVKKIIAQAKGAQEKQEQKG